MHIASASQRCEDAHKQAVDPSRQADRMLQKRKQAARSVLRCFLIYLRPAQCVLSFLHLSSPLYVGRCASLVCCRCCSFCRAVSDVLMLFFASAALVVLCLCAGFCRLIVAHLCLLRCIARLFAAWRLSHGYGVIAGRLLREGSVESLSTTGAPPLICACLLPCARRDLPVSDQPNVGGRNMY